jgi:hypothetical protein
MSKQKNTLAAQKQAVAEFRAAEEILGRVKELMPRGNPALNPYIRALVAGFENWLADPHTAISKEPPRVTRNADGSHTVERGEARISPNGFIWMSRIWLKSTEEWIGEQSRRKKRDKKARERLHVLRQAKKSLSPDLYRVAHAYHNFVMGKQPCEHPRSEEEIVLNTDEFLAETARLNLEVSRVELAHKRRPALGEHKFETIAQKASLARRSFLERRLSDFLFILHAEAPFFHKITGKAMSPPDVGRSYPLAGNKNNARFRL